MSNELVTDAEVESALDWLRDHAAEIGKAKYEMVKAEYMLRHVKALVMQMHGNVAVNAQEREAYASNKYRDAIEKAAETAGKFEEMKSLREAAALKIEVYRSASANYRAMKL